MPALQQETSISAQRRSRRWLWVLLGVLLGIGLVLATRVMTRSVPWFSPHTNTTQSSVVREIRSLQRMETVVYTLDQIVTREKTYAMLPSSLAGDRILLIVHGDVTAGIDLAQLQPQDVSVSGRTVSIHLPTAQVFSTRVDNGQTRVYSRDTGAFSAPDPQLESDARRLAEEQLTAAAMKDGILDNASRNARANISTLLHSLKFEQVEFR
jgi:hypothetical protein